MRISLIPVSGGTPFVMTFPIALVGRKEDCDWQLDAEGIAELHCVLVLADDMLLLRDLDTGTIRVNGQRVRRAVLLANDILDIAGSRFRVEYAD
jgi:predicted component of type VI protein secretion system